MSKNKVITTQFKLIEMSQTRAREWIEKYILRKTKLPLIVNVSVSKKTEINEITNFFPRFITVVF